MHHFYHYKSKHAFSKFLSSSDEEILVYSGVNILDLITKFLGFKTAKCFHNSFTTIKQHYIKTIIMVQISKGLTWWCLPGTKYWLK